MKNILSRAYKTLNLIRYSFSCGNSPQTKKILYLPLVHSQLTYCSQIWHPHLLKDIIILEKIQHRVTKYRNVPLIRPPHFVHYIQPKVGRGRTFEDAISLDYRPPRKIFATYTNYYDTAKVHVHSKNDRQYCL